MMQSQTSDDAIPRNLIIFVGGLKLLVVTVESKGELMHPNRWVFFQEIKDPVRPQKVLLWVAENAEEVWCLCMQRSTRCYFSSDKLETCR